MGRLLATIRSRCQRVLLPAPDAEAAQRWLAGQGVKDADAALAMAGGAPLAALAFAADDYQAARRAFVDCWRPRTPITSPPPRASRKTSWPTSSPGCKPG